jgi:hypothetical protein
MSNFTDFFPAPSATVETGTTAQRSGSPTAGVARFNTDIKKYEVYDGSNWVLLNSLMNFFKADIAILSTDTSIISADQTKY